MQLAEWGGGGWVGMGRDRRAVVMEKGVGARDLQGFKTQVRRKREGIPDWGWAGEQRRNGKEGE